MPRISGGTHACPHCPEKFNKPNGLTRHLGQQHGINARKRPPSPSEKKKRRPRSAPAFMSVTLKHKVTERYFSNGDDPNIGATARLFYQQLCALRDKIDKDIAVVKVLAEAL